MSVAWNLLGVSSAAGYLSIVSSLSRYVLLILLVELSTGCRSDNGYILGVKSDAGYLLSVSSYAGHLLSVFGNY